jgi:hypothetical protein
MPLIDACEADRLDGAKFKCHKGLAGDIYLVAINTKSGDRYCCRRRFKLAVVSEINHNYTDGIGMPIACYRTMVALIRPPSGASFFSKASNEPNINAEYFSCGLWNCSDWSQ